MTQWHNGVDYLDLCWIDIIATVVGLVFVNGALTGKFYTRRRLVAATNSFSLRSLFLVIAAAIYIVVVFDLRSKLG